MMKKSMIISILTIMSIATYGQDLKKEVENVKTKMDVFASKTGTIIKFTDSKLSNLKASYGSAQTRVRKITSGASSVFFYQIVKEGKYGNTTASIEYSDLIEVIKALKALKLEVDKDILVNPEYMENRFVTVDGFQVGYYISAAKASWYLKLEKSGSDNTLFVESVETIETAFNEAKNKIDELKK